MSGDPSRLEAAVDACCWGLALVLFAVDVALGAFIGAMLGEPAAYLVGWYG